MKKTTKIFEIIKRIIRSPGVIRELFDEEAYYKKKTIRDYSLPQGLPQVNILDLFPDFNETVEPYSFLDGTSLPIDIALLKKCASHFSDCRYLEIGTWRGESVANVSAVALNAITINLPDEKMLEMGLPQGYVSMHRYFSKNLKNVKHIQHNSHTFDFDGIKEKPDLIFIDGDHHYESVRMDTINAFKTIKSDHSIIIWHDYAFSPESVRWAVMAGILDGCPAEKRKHLFQVSNTMCSIYTTMPVRATALVPFQKPDKYFSVKIMAHRT